MVQICVSCNQQNMHLAEGATPGTSSDDRLLQFSNSSMQSQQPTQREQVPHHVPSSPASGVPLPPHANSSKSIAHDSNALSVRYKVRNHLITLECRFRIYNSFLFQPYDPSNSSKDPYASQQALQKSYSRREPSNSPQGPTENGHGFPYVLKLLVTKFHLSLTIISLSAVTSVNKFTIPHI